MITEPLDLDAIRKRADAATAGPWRADWRCSNVVSVWRDTGKFENEVVADVWDEHETGAMDRTDEQMEADGEFIAHARQDIPALIAEVERLKDELLQVPRPAP